MNAKFEALDGAVQFQDVQLPPPLTVQFAYIPRITVESVGLHFKYREYEYEGRSESGVFLYREVDK